MCFVVDFDSGVVGGLRELQCGNHVFGLLFCDGRLCV